MSKLSTDQILQISNDISENMLNPRTTRDDLVQVVKFFRDLADEKHERFMRLWMELGLMMMKHSPASTNASEVSPKSAPPNPVALEVNKR